MLSLIDRLAKWWLRRRGITTISVHGGTVTIKDGRIDELNQTGGIVHFTSDRKITFPTVQGGTVHLRPSPYLHCPSESPAPQS